MKSGKRKQEQEYRIKTAELSKEEQAWIDEMKSIWVGLTFDRKVECLNYLYNSKEAALGVKLIANIFSLCEMSEVISLFANLRFEIQCKFVATIVKTDINEFMKLLPADLAMKIYRKLKEEGNSKVKQLKVCTEHENIEAHSVHLMEKFKAWFIASMRDELICSVAGMVVDTWDEILDLSMNHHEKVLHMKDKEKQAIKLNATHQFALCIDRYSQCRDKLLKDVLMVERNTILRYNGFVATTVWQKYDPNGELAYAAMSELAEYTKVMREDIDKELNKYFKKTFFPDLASKCIMLKVYAKFIDLTCGIITKYIKSQGLYSVTTATGTSRIYTDQIRKMAEFAGQMLSVIGVERDVVNKKTHDIYAAHFTTLGTFLFTDEMEEQRKSFRRTFCLWYICKFALGDLDVPVAKNCKETHADYLLQELPPFLLEGGMCKQRFMKDVKALKRYAEENDLHTAEALVEEIDLNISGKQFILPSVFKMIDTYKVKFLGPTFSGDNTIYIKLVEALSNIKVA